MSDVHPSWVPESVVRMATVFTCNEAAKRRLMIDPRMEEVWADFLDSPVNPETYRSLRGFQCLEGFDQNELRFTLSQKAAAAMLSIGLVEFQNEHIIKLGDMRKTVTQWKLVASWCETVWSVDYAPIGDPELEASLARVGAHFSDLAGRFATLSGPRVLRRGSRNKSRDPVKQRDLDLIRAKSSSLIAFADKLYERKHRKSLATFCSVGLDRGVTVSDVDDYRASLGS